MFKYIINIVLFLFLNTVQAQMAPFGIINPDSFSSDKTFWFNHSATVIVVDSGTVLRSGQKLNRNAVVVTVTSAEQEARMNTTIRAVTSADDGQTFGDPIIIVDSSETQGANTAWNMNLYESDSGRIYLFYLYQPGEGGGSTGQFSLALRYMYSDDLGLSWSPSTQAAFYPNIFSDSMKFVGPKGKLTDWGMDSLAFPIYYRYVGNSTIFRGSVVVDKKFTSFNFYSNESNLAYNDINYIEPVSERIGNRFVTFVRNTTGRLISEICDSPREEGSLIQNLKIPNPGAPVSTIQVNGKLYMTLNYSPSNRYDLSIVELDTQNYEVKASFSIQNHANEIDQVSYPDMDASGGNIYLVYSVMNDDTTNSIRFSSIHFKKINLDSLKPSGTVQLGDEFIQDCSINSVLKKSAEVLDRLYFLTFSGELYSLDNSGNWNYSFTQLDQINIIDISKSGDTLIVLGSNGIYKFYNEQIYQVAQGNFSSWSLLSCISSYTILNRRREFEVYDLTGSIAFKGALPQIGPSGPIAGLNNIIIGAYADSSNMNLVTNLGNIYRLNLTSKSTERVYSVGNELHGFLNLEEGRWVSVNKQNSSITLYHKNDELSSVACDNMNSNLYGHSSDKVNSLSFLSCGSVIYTVKDDSLTKWKELAFPIISAVHYIGPDSLIWVDLFGKAGLLNAQVLQVYNPSLKEIEVSLYPNPVKAGRRVYIEIPSNKNIVSYSFYSLIGHKVSTGTLEVLAPQQPGVYILQINFSDGDKFSNRIQVK